MYNKINGILWDIKDVEADQKKRYTIKDEDI